MKFSLIAFTSLLTTDPVQGYHAPTKEGFFMDKLSKPGSRKTFRTGKLTSVFHSITPLIICYITI
jgi:hypothetical protein